MDYFKTVSKHLSGGTEKYKMKTQIKTNGPQLGSELTNSWMEVNMLLPSMEVGLKELSDINIRQREWSDSQPGEMLHY